MAGPLLQVEGLHHRYAGGPEVLRGLSFALEARRICVVLGPSGCGKTTLLRLVAGLMPPSAGRVRVDGRPPRPGRDTAMIFQQPRLLPWHTVAQNLALVLPRRGRADRIAALLSRVGLSDTADLYPEELSSGMQQRIALVRSLAVPAPLLLMDEPFANLDDAARARMQHEVRRAVATEPRRGVLFVTHSTAEAEALADEVIRLGTPPAGSSQQG
ncbi:ABC transporter ATP-binding protein [Paracoccus aminovorans]|uniref:ABC transporter ATP-binding protein n=1 Tax=Paracoccus aminovorans TaxID=34004 RepID=UPI002B25B822|nr:ATP-binding cassette domain-containing protein [Paracoccus aminovorans]